MNLLKKALDFQLLSLVLRAVEKTAWLRQAIEILKENNLVMLYT